MYLRAVVVVQLLLLYLEPLVYDTIRDIANINLHSSAEHISVCWPHYIMTDMLAEVSSWSVLYWFSLRTKQETHIRCNLSLSATTDIIMSNSESGPQSFHSGGFIDQSISISLSWNLRRHQSEIDWKLLWRMPFR